MSNTACVSQLPNDAPPKSAKKRKIASTRVPSTAKEPKTLRKANRKTSSKSLRSASTTRTSNKKKKSVKEQGQVQSAQARVAALAPETWVFFTDGSALKNPGPCGAGMIGCLWTSGSAVSPQRLCDLVAAGQAGLKDARFGQWCEVSVHLGLGTNNIGELNGIGLALNELELRKEHTNHEGSGSVPVAIFTDSTYAVGVLSKNWNAQKNQELIASLKSRLSALQPHFIIELIWVKAHVGLPGNERADQLANEGCSNTFGVKPGAPVSSDGQQVR